MMKPLWIFLHISKCGGTTFKTNLEHNFRPKECLFIADRELQVFAGQPRDDMMAALIGKDRDRIRLLHGHGAMYGIHKYFPGREFRYVLILRDPVKRVISTYNYRRRQLDDPRSKRKIGGVHFENLDNFPVWLKTNPQTTNYITKALVDRLLRCPENIPEKGDHSALRVEPTPVQVEEITKILASFYFVGILENPEDLLFLYGELGVTRFVPVQNTSPRYMTKSEQEDYDELIRSENRFDLELYERAKQLNRDGKLALPHFSDSVHRARTWQSISSRLYPLAYRGVQYLNRRYHRFRRF